MINLFNVTGSNAILSPSSKKVVAVSSNTGDSQNVSLAGIISGSAGSNTVALLSGKREAVSADIFSSLASASISAAPSGTVTLREEGTAAIGYVVLLANPSDGDTLDIGLSGYVQTYTFVASLSGSADEVLIGATAADTADNLRRAINNAGTAGTHYGTGTSANAFLSATVSDVTLTLTDRIKCARSLSWACATSNASAISVLNPVNGANGTTLATLTSGTRSAFNTLSFDNEALASANLPAALTPTTDAVRIGGRAPFSIEHVTDGANVGMKIQSSTDNGTTWRDHDTFTVTTSFARKTVTDALEMIRLVATSNTNTVAKAIHIKAVSP